MEEEMIFENRHPSESLLQPSQSIPINLVMVAKRPFFLRENANFVFTWDQGGQGVFDVLSLFSNSVIASSRVDIGMEELPS